MFGVEEALEILRSVPIPFWLVASVVFLSVGIGPDHVAAVHEFTAHRMQHFDLHGVRYGSRSALINMEAKGEGASMLNRRCVVVRWRNLTSQSFQSLIQRGAGAILILLSHSNQASEEELESWVALELELFKQEVPIPVYFAWESEDLINLHEILNASAEKEKDSSVASLLLATLGDYGYQMVTVGEVETKPIKGSAVTSIVGTLNGQGIGHKLPTIAFLAHYDAMGLAPTLSYGVDSNASGTAAVVELARLFSRLYNDPNTRPKYNLIFVLSGSGKFNYFGTKGLLDEQGDDSLLLSSADYTLCLDSLLSSEGEGDDTLYFHVSKPPKEGTKPHRLLQSLNESSELLSPEMQLELVHKKVKLSEDLLAWEHERFSLKRLAAGTISALSSHKNPRRSSMFASRSQMNMSVLVRNVRVIAEGVARYIYSISDVDSERPTPFLGFGGNDVHEDFLSVWIHFLSSHARSPQLIDSEHPVVKGLEEVLEKYTHEVATFIHQPDKSDPEFRAYDLTSSLLAAYRVKPAIFDLFLAFGIALYAFIWYFLVLLFGRLQTLIATYFPFPLVIRKTKGD